ncbi:MAG: 2-polyprenylphenol 6-hydroxylase [Cohaesibacteraceae bacterium]|nr:2-polyprenylphenol 6-hydroxylase [Cohaesibacteraceae bacterium]
MLPGLVRVGFVLVREGVLSVIPLPDLPLSARFLVRFARLFEKRTISTKSTGERLSSALNRLGPSYIKLGQFLAARPDLIGEDLALALSTLQDQVPSFSMEEAKASVCAALGKDVDDLFDSFSDPVAAASIAQVHKAEITDEAGVTQTLAIKILRPGIHQRFQKDLDGFYVVARFVEWLHPPIRRLKPVGVVDTLSRSMTFELDLRLEAAALSEIAENCQDDPDFRVPGVNWQRSSKTVLSMEWIDGYKVSDRQAIMDAGFDCDKLGELVIQSFLRQALRDGFFHADMHPGNLFIDHDGNLVPVDFGIMGRIGMTERRFLAEILYGFIIRDYDRVSRVHFDAGYIPAHQNIGTFAQALRSIGEPLQGRPASEISMGGLLSQLFEFTEVFEMQTRTELIMLQKTMVVVEGVGRLLNPELNMWTAAEPVVRDWIEKNVGPAAKIRQALNGVEGLISLGQHLPDLAARAQKLAIDFEDAGSQGMKLDPDTILAIGKAEARASRSGRVALWVIAGALLVLVYQTLA